MNAGAQSQTGQVRTGRFGGFAAANRDTGTQDRTRKGSNSRKSRRKAERPLHGCNVRIDHETGRIDWSHLKNPGERMAVLAPGELDDSLDDLFGPIDPASIRPFEQNVPVKRHPDGTIDLGPETEALAAKIKAERKAEARAAAAEARKIRNAEKRAAGLPLRAPAKTVTLAGRDIPATLRGKPVVTGRFTAKTGEALVIDVAFRNKVHTGIIVWAGAYQSLVAEAAAKNKALDFTIAQPANERFKPSVRTAA